MLFFTFCHIYSVKTISVCARNQSEPQLIQTGFFFLSWPWKVSVK